MAHPKTVKEAMPMITAKRKLIKIPYNVCLTSQKKAPPQLRRPPALTARDGICFCFRFTLRLGYELRCSWVTRFSRILLTLTASAAASALAASSVVTRHLIVLGRRGSLSVWRLKYFSSRTLIHHRTGIRRPKQRYIGSQNRVHAAYKYGFGGHKRLLENIRAPAGRL